MIKKNHLIITSIFISIVMTESAIGSMRCGTHLISANPASPSGKYEILKRCGEPTERYGDTWLYKSGSVTRTLNFNSSGQLQSIQ
jgi:hypothetical protein